MARILISLILFACLLACKKESSSFELTAEDYKLAMESGRDTTVITRNGKKYLFVNGFRIDKIDKSINDEVYYAYDVVDGKRTYDLLGKITKFVYKEEFYTKTFKVTINDDTLYVGEPFVSKIWTKDTGYRINFNEPVQQLSEVVPKEDGPFQFEFNCDTAGEYNFKGELIKDSVVVTTFNYKFLVLEGRDPARLQ